MNAANSLNLHKRKRKGEIEIAEIKGMKILMKISSSEMAVRILTRKPTTEVFSLGVVAYRQVTGNIYNRRSAACNPAWKRRHM